MSSPARPLPLTLRCVAACTLAPFVLALTLVASACDRRAEIPAAPSPAACSARDLGQAADLPPNASLPVDHLVTLEGMPHPIFFGWNHNGRKRAVSKLLGTERRLLLLQEFSGDAPPTTAKMTGLLRRWADLPANPWDAVRAGIADQFGWEVPPDALLLMEGFSPSGCP